MLILWAKSKISLAVISLKFSGSVSAQSFVAFASLFHPQVSIPYRAFLRSCDPEPMLQGSDRDKSELELKSPQSHSFTPFKLTLNDYFIGKFTIMRSSLFVRKLLEHFFWRLLCELLKQIKRP